MSFIDIKKFLLGFFGVIFTSAFVNIPPVSAQSAFDMAIEKGGGIQKGRVSYLSFSSKFNPSLDAAVRRQFKSLISNTYISNKTYSYVEVDINNDGRKDAFVQINNSLGSGSGGNHTWVFQSKENSYELVNIFYHQVALVILPNNISGWQNILRVPGKIFTPNNPNMFYSQCSYIPSKQWEGDRDFSSPNNYRNCQKVQLNSVVSGMVVNTSTFGRNYPAFDLAYK